MAKWQRSFFQPVLPLGEDGRRVTGSKEHIALSRMAAGEGMVLLKNEKNTLPIRYLPDLVKVLLSKMQKVLHPEGNA